MLLTYGDHGPYVRDLQDNLVALGFGKKMERYGVDGSFGNETGNAVEAFQKWADIKVDRMAGTQTLNKIASRKHSAGIKGTYNFQLSEFHSKDGGGMREGGMDSELLLKLERIRYHFNNQPVHINSGYRTKSHNKKVGGAKNSQHLYGRAADIVVGGVSATRVYNYANKLFKNGGVGKYNTFTHVDTRGYRSRF